MRNAAGRGCKSKEGGKWSPKFPQGKINLATGSLGRRGDHHCRKAFGSGVSREGGEEGGDYPDLTRDFFLRGAACQVKGRREGKREGKCEGGYPYFWGETGEERGKEKAEV